VVFDTNVFVSAFIHLLALKEFEGIPLVRLADFLRMTPT
jgi:hypothetical protein